MSITNTAFFSTIVTSSDSMAPAIPKKSRKSKPKKIMSASREAKKLLKKLFTLKMFR
jgi:hypothetical protein